MEFVKAFNDELSSLFEVKPPVTRIKMMSITKQAMKAGRYYKHIILGVEKFIQKCPPEYKVPGLYVIDSIVRQSRHQFGVEKDLFTPRFARNIAATITCLIDASRPEDTGRVIRVLNLWQKNNIYPPNIIQPLLDLIASPHDRELVLTVQARVEEVYGAAARSLTADAHQQSTQQAAVQQLPKQPTQTAAADNSRPAATETSQQQSNLLKSIQQLVQQQQIASGGSGTGLQQQLQVQMLQQQLFDGSFLAQIQALTSALVNRTLAPSTSDASNNQKSAGLESISRGLALHKDAASLMASLGLTLPEPKRAPDKELGEGEDMELEPGELVESPPPPAAAPQQAELLTRGYGTQGHWSPSHPAGSSSHQGLPPPEPDSLTSPVRSGRRGYTTEASTDTPTDTLRKEVKASSSRVMDDDDDDIIYVSRSSSSSSSDRSRSRSRRKRKKKSSDRSRKRNKDDGEMRERSASNEERRRALFLPPIRSQHLCVCSTTLWLGHVSKKTTSEDLLRELSPHFGYVCVNLLPSRGCAFVSFETRQLAALALQRLRGTVLNGNTLKVAWAPGEGIKRASEFMDKWDVDLGVSYIPWKRLPAPLDLAKLAEGGAIDDETLPHDWLEQSHMTGQTLLGSFGETGDPAHTQLFGNQLPPLPEGVPPPANYSASGAPPLPPGTAPPPLPVLPPSGNLAPVMSSMAPTYGDSGAMLVSGIQQILDRSLASSSSSIATPGMGNPSFMSYAHQPAAPPHPVTSCPQQYAAPHLPSLHSQPPGFSMQHPPPNFPSFDFTRPPPLPASHQSVDVGAAASTEESTAASGPSVGSERNRGSSQFTRNRTSSDSRYGNDGIFGESGNDNEVSSTQDLLGVSDEEGSTSRDKGVEPNMHYQLLPSGMLSRSDVVSSGASYGIPVFSATSGMMHAGASTANMLPSNSVGAGFPNPMTSSVYPHGPLPPGSLSFAAPQVSTMQNVSLVNLQLPPPGFVSGPVVQHSLPSSSALGHPPVQVLGHQLPAGTPVMLTRPDGRQFEAVQRFPGPEEAQRPPMPIMNRLAPPPVLVPSSPGVLPQYRPTLDAQIRFLLPQQELSPQVMQGSVNLAPRLPNLSLERLRFPVPDGDVPQQLLGPGFQQAAPSRLPAPGGFGVEAGRAGMLEREAGGHLARERLQMFLPDAAPGTEHQHSGSQLKPHRIEAFNGLTSRNSHQHDMPRTPGGDLPLRGQSPSLRAPPKIGLTLPAPPKLSRFEDVGEGHQMKRHRPPNTRPREMFLPEREHDFGPRRGFEPRRFVARHRFEPRHEFGPRPDFGPRLRFETRHHFGLGHRFELERSFEPRQFRRHGYPDDERRYGQRRDNARERGDEGRQSGSRGSEPVDESKADAEGEEEEDETEYDIEDDAGDEEEDVGCTESGEQRDGVQQRAAGSGIEKQELHLSGGGGELQAGGPVESEQAGQRTGASEGLNCEVNT